LVSQELVKQFVTYLFLSGITDVGYLSFLLAIDHINIHQFFVAQLHLSLPAQTVFQLSVYVLQPTTFIMTFCSNFRPISLIYFLAFISKAALFSAHS